ncbi:hypothetical protein ACFWH1_18395 [Streptomyces sp. NPDC127037]|uniref:hypothetical protein n=1 Tax=Streptomyces sp. NPDC127037 TaxID=3347113 RepID=UPI00365136E7
MSDPIQIRPTPAQRVEFARWAVAQTPKVRTVGPATFSVPAALFAGMPESVLIGATVDGHRYVSPDEDQEQAGELLGVATPEGFNETPAAEPGEPLPEEPAPGTAGEREAAPEGVFPCSGCDREFTTERGRDAHQRQKHAEG